MILIVEALLFYFSVFIVAQSSSQKQGCLWGATYSPYNTNGTCPDANKVAQDLQTVSSVAQNIRLYSTDCSQLKSALSAVDSGIQLGIYAGIWVSSGATRFQQDLNEFVEAVKACSNKKCVQGVSVGNEELFNNNMSESQLVDYINQVRDRLKQEGLDIPIYTTDTDDKFTSDLANACDVVQVNIYSMFDKTYTSINDSVTSVFTRFDALKQKINIPNKPFRIGETGWSSSGSTGVVPTSLELEQQYHDSFVCQANAKGMEYFCFEAKDADWKQGAAQIEKTSGLFKSDFTSKIDLQGTCQCN